MPYEYDHIAHGYDHFRRGGGPYLDQLIQLARDVSAARVLELGCGTANEAALFLQAHPCALIGLDKSRGMLARARAKRLPAQWLHADAERLPLRTASVDMVFAVYLLHHLRDLAPVFRECARVLRRGAAAFVTAPHDFIRRHPMNAYFPSFARVDTARFQPVEAVCDALRDAGFTRTHARNFIDPPRPIDRDYADKIAQKFISTYALIPDDEFHEGLRRLRADLEPAGRLEKTVAREATVVWGLR